MQERTVQFKPADGSAPRKITLRIGAPAMDQAENWSALIEVLGFDEPYAKHIIGSDWAQALELAAKLLPIVLDLRVHQAGGGTLEPPFATLRASQPS